MGALRWVKVRSRVVLGVIDKLSDTDSDDAVAEALRSLVTIVRRGEIRGASRARAYRGGDSVVRGSS